MQLSRVHVVGGGGDKGNKGVAVGSVCSAVCGAIWLTPSFIYDMFNMSNDHMI